MRVLCVTSEREQCGIREYSEQLIEAMPEVDWEVCGPEPPAFFDVDLLWLNHHQALHSMWNDGSRVKVWQGLGVPVVVTQHDTYETLQIMLDRGHPDFRGADALIVHEQVEGLEGAHVIRQGVLSAPAQVEPIHRGLDNDRSVMGPPVVGTAGWNFPWKGFDAVCRASAVAGWGVLLLTTGATVEDCERWTSLNPECEIIPQWLPRQEVVQRLGQCDATAWLYTSGNSGTSGAVRLGLATGRPCLLYRNRQFRDLYGSQTELLFSAGEDQVAEILRTKDRWEERTRLVQEIAERDSWTNVAKRYKEIFEAVLR